MKTLGLLPHKATVSLSLSLFLYLALSLSVSLVLSLSVTSHLLFRLPNSTPTLISISLLSPLYQEVDKRVKMLLEYKDNLHRTQAALRKQSQRRARQNKEKEAELADMTPEEK